MRVNLKASDGLVAVKWADGDEAEATIYVRPLSWLEEIVHAERLRGIGPNPSSAPGTKPVVDRAAVITEALIDRTERWEGLVDGDGKPIECTPEMRRALFGQYEAAGLLVYGAIIGSRRSDPARPTHSGAGSASSGSAPESTAAKDTNTATSASETPAAAGGAAAS